MPLIAPNLQELVKVPLARGKMIPDGSCLPSLGAWLVVMGTLPEGLPTAATTATTGLAVIIAARDQLMDIFDYVNSIPSIEYVFLP